MEESILLTSVRRIEDLESSVDRAANFYHQRKVLLTLIGALESEFAKRKELRGTEIETAIREASSGKITDITSLLQLYKAIIGS